MGPFLIFTGYYSCEPLPIHPHQGWNHPPWQPKLWVRAFFFLYPNRNSLPRCCIISYLWPNGLEGASKWERTKKTLQFLWLGNLFTTSLGCFFGSFIFCLPLVCVTTMGPRHFSGIAFGLNWLNLCWGDWAVEGNDRLRWMRMKIKKMECKEKD